MGPLRALGLHLYTYIHIFIYTLREPRRGHSRLIGHEGCSWCVLMRLVVYVGLCVGLSGAVCGPWREPEGPWEVLGRRWRVLRWFLDVPGRPWGVFGRSLGVPGASWEVLGRPLRVLGGFVGVPGRSLGGPWGVLGAALGGPWGAHRSLGGPGAPWGVRGGFLEMVIVCCWKVILLLV